MVKSGVSLGGSVGLISFALISYVGNKAVTILLILYAFNWCEGGGALKKHI